MEYIDLVTVCIVLIVAAILVAVVGSVWFLRRYKLVKRSTSKAIQNLPEQAIPDAQHTGHVYENYHNYDNHEI